MTKQMFNLLWNAVFGNGKKGLVESVAIMKVQLGFLLLMNIGIIGLLIKIIFFSK